VKTPAAPVPIVTDPTGTQSCTGGRVDFTLAADTFTDPSGGTLAYAATLSNGAHSGDHDHSFRRIATIRSDRSRPV